MSARLELNPVIHSPKRLAAMAVLVSSTATDFGFLKQHLGIADADLSKQMAALREAGYVEIRKQGHGRGGQTTYTITPAGRDAYREYRRQLQELLGE